MKSIYFKILVSTCYTFQNNRFKTEWKIMSLFFISINFMLNLVSIWLLLYHFILPGFTDFLAINFEKYENPTLLYLLIYFFFPMLLFNSIFILNSNNLNNKFELYEKYKNIKIFRIHFFGSFLISYIVILFVFNYSTPISTPNKKLKDKTTIH